MTDAAHTRHISLNAHVAPWAVLGDGCVVHDFALIGRLPSTHSALARQPAVLRWLKIGRNVDIGAHAIIYGGATIGDDCLIGDAALIREGAVIGSGCVVGAHVTVSYNAVLGDNVRIQNYTLVTDECRVGEGTFIGVGVTMASDRRRDVVKYEFTGSTPPIIGKRCLIGSGAVLVPGVTIGDDAVIAAGALVAKDVPPGGTVMGTPARLRPGWDMAPGMVSLDWPVSDDDVARALQATAS